VRFAVLVTLVLLVSSVAESGAATQVGPANGVADVDGYRDLLVWSERRPAPPCHEDPAVQCHHFVLMMRRAGVVTQLPVAPSHVPFRADLGPGPSGPTATYARCGPEDDYGVRCSVRLLDLRTGRETSLRVPQGASDYLPTIWGRRIAFVRRTDNFSRDDPGTVLVAQIGGRRRLARVRLDRVRSCAVSVIGRICYPFTLGTIHALELQRRRVVLAFGGRWPTISAPARFAALLEGSTRGGIARLLAMSRHADRRLPVISGLTLERGTAFALYANLVAPQRPLVLRHRPGRRLTAATVADPRSAGFTFSETGTVFLAGECQHPLRIEHVCTAIETGALRFAALPPNSGVR
jgi:hypothetical protein